MDRRVTSPKRVTSLTWGPPPPCKQALKRDTSRNSLVTRLMEEILVSLFTLVFHCRSFSPSRPLVFLIPHRRYKFFMFFFQLNWSQFYFRMPDFDSCQFIFIRMAYITDRIVSICARSYVTLEIVLHVVYLLAGVRRCHNQIFITKFS